MGAPDVGESLLDRELIRDLVQRYARGVDRRDFDLVRSCYHPDAIDEHGPYRGGVDGFIEFLGEQLARWSVTQHVIGNSLIEFEGDRAHVETYAVAYHRTLPTPGRPVRDLTAGCRYVDVMEKRDDRWGIVHRVVVMDWSRLDDVDARSVDPNDGYERGAHFPDDASYRIMRTGNRRPS